MTKKINVSKSLKELEEIVNWFEQQKNIDIEKGLEQVKNGAVIIKDLKKRLKKVENEFQEIKEDLKE
jgi:exodeoxyribonuclease VII small subunit